ncbi:uncharacterized protein LOC62_01G000749 [Vanrija pseudolonga]|uniref:Uncharacterized protein n=1 Tax=Vanrija pseudolonga TaxID=143232 RepID=A0AAF0XZP6_9TREE|nr:hypothetical protein LOC62_01G000749 [Vanrija pseudolonga]
MAASKLLAFVRSLGRRRERYDPDAVYFATPVEDMIGACDGSSEVGPRVPAPSRRSPRLVFAGPPRRMDRVPSGDFVEQLIDTESDLFNWDTSSAETSSSEEEAPVVARGAAHAPDYLDFLAAHGLTAEVLGIPMPPAEDVRPGTPETLASILGVHNQDDETHGVSVDRSENAQSEPRSSTTSSADQSVLEQAPLEPEDRVSAAPAHQSATADSEGDPSDLLSFSSPGEIIRVLDPRAGPVDFFAELKDSSSMAPVDPPLSPVETLTVAEVVEASEPLPPSTDSGVKNSGRRVVFEDQLGRVRQFMRKTARRFSQQEGGEPAPREYTTTAIPIPRRLTARERRSRGHDVVWDAPKDPLVTVTSILRHSPPPPPLALATLPPSARVSSPLATILLADEERTRS